MNVPLVIRSFKFFTKSRIRELHTNSRINVILDLSRIILILFLFLNRGLEKTKDKSIGIHNYSAFQLTSLKLKYPLLLRATHLSSVP